MDTISDRQTYLRRFSEKAKSNPKWQCDALKYALDIRKFEIDLYWRRTAYFWAFTAVCFGGYFALQKGDGKEFLMSFFLSCIGLVLSFAWYFVNRGSKYWQETWELNVNLLEDEIIGPLYKTNIPMKQTRFWNLLGPYPFSVSKINHIVSLFAIVIWVFFIAYTIYQKFRPMSGEAIIAIPFSLFTVVVVIFLGHSKTSFSEGEREFNLETRIMQERKSEDAEP